MSEVVILFEYFFHQPLLTCFFFILKNLFTLVLNIPIYVSILTEAMTVSIMVSCRSRHFITRKTSSFCLYGKWHCWRVVKGAGCSRLYPSTTCAPVSSTSFTLLAGSVVVIVKLATTCSCVGIHILGPRC